MVKVFDYNQSSKGWISFPDYDQAKKYVLTTLDDYYFIDRIHHEDYLMEIYFDDKYEVWVGDFDGWYAQETHKNIFKSCRSDWSFNFTKLDPKEYA